MLRLKTAAWALLLLFAIGCGGPPAGEVRGTVTYQGEPLSSGTVMFMPQTEGAMYAQAEIAEDGSYVATTEASGTRIPVGSYRVMISAVKDMGPEAPVEPLIPLKYGSDVQSGLTAEVQEGENIVNFNLDP